MLIEILKWIAIWLVAGAVVVAFWSLLHADREGK